MTFKKKYGIIFIEGKEKEKKVKKNMAKISFGSLNIKKVDEGVNTFTFNGKEIEVRRYLPITDKLTLIGNAISLAADGNRFANPMKINMYLNLEIMFAYTNITFTDKQKEDLVKLYDILDSAGFFNLLYENMEPDEIYAIRSNTKDLSDNMYKQMNSFYGVMDNVSKDYVEVGAESEKIQKALSDPENLKFLKTIMNKLG